jgi:hypothetical protein
VFPIIWQLYSWHKWKRIDSFWQSHYNNFSIKRVEFIKTINTHSKLVLIFANSQKRRKPNSEKQDNAGYFSHTSVHIYSTVDVGFVRQVHYSFIHRITIRYVIQYKTYKLNVIFQSTIFWPSDVRGGEQKSVFVPACETEKSWVTVNEWQWGTSEQVNERLRKQAD